MKSISKVSQIRNLLATNPNLSAKEIAKQVGCHETLIYQVKKGKAMKANVAVAKVRKAKQVKKIGRPSKTSIEANALTQACEVLQNLVKNIKHFCVAFDHEKDKVEIVWGEEIYNTPTHDMNRVIESIKYMESIKQTFN